MIDLFLPHIQAQPAAAVVNVSSAPAFVPQQSAPVSCASKAALHSFTKALRRKPEGATVEGFAIIPALADTEATKGGGGGKITPDALAVEAMRWTEPARTENMIGKAALLFALPRLLPAFAEPVIRHG